MKLTEHLLALNILNKFCFVTNSLTWLLQLQLYEETNSTKGDLNAPKDIFIFIRFGSAFWGCNWLLMVWDVNVSYI